MPCAVAERGREALVLQGFGLASFELRLAKLSGLFGAGSGFEFGLFAEITPARLALFHALAVFVLLGRRLRVLFAFDNGCDSAGFIGANVVADDCVRGFEFFAGQTGSGMQLVLREDDSACRPQVRVAGTQ